MAVAAAGLFLYNCGLCTGAARRGKFVPANILPARNVAKRSALNETHGPGWPLPRKLRHSWELRHGENSVLFNRNHALWILQVHKYFVTQGEEERGGFGGFRRRPVERVCTARAVDGVRQRPSETSSATCGRRAETRHQRPSMASSSKTTRTTSPCCVTFAARTLLDVAPPAVHGCLPPPLVAQAGAQVCARPPAAVRVGMQVGAQLAASAPSWRAGCSTAAEACRPLPPPGAQARAQVCTWVAQARAQVCTWVGAYHAPRW